MMRSVWRATAAACFLGVFLAPQLARAQQRPLTPDDILDVVWVSSPALSPDGEDVAYIINDPLKAKSSRRQSRLYKAPSDKSSPAQIIAPAHPFASRPSWSPDGQLLAFLSSGAEGKDPPQIHLLAQSGVGIRQLKTYEAVMSYRWSPVGTELAFTSFGKPEEGGGAPEPLVVGGPGKQASLWAVSATDGKTRRVTQGDAHILDFAWSPDGKEFAVTVAPSSEPEDVVNRTSLQVIDGKSGRVLRTMNVQVGGGIPLAWSPDGTNIAFPLAAPKRIGHRLALVPRTGDAPSFPLADYRGTPNAVHWMADSSALIVQTFEKTRNRLIRVDLASGKITQLAETVHNFWGHSASADGRTLAVMADAPHSPPNVEVLREGQAAVRLTQLNRGVSEYRLGKVQDLKWKSSLDGRAVYGVLITPPDLEPGTRVPTVVQLHGGPHAAWWNGWMGTWLSVGQLLASNGYAVLQPNHRGSVGQGWEFAEAHYQEWVAVTIRT